MNSSLNQNSNFSNERINEIALSWVGTSFKKHGRVKKIGVDCIGLILGLLDELSHPNLCKIPLSNDYSLEEKTPILLNILRSCFEEITSIETPAITLFEYEGGYQHLGVAFKTNDKILAIIHADITARKVVMHSLDEDMKKRIKAIFKL